MSHWLHKWFAVLRSFVLGHDCDLHGDCIYSLIHGQVISCLFVASWIGSVPSNLWWLCEVMGHGHIIGRTWLKTGPNLALCNMLGEATDTVPFSSLGICLLFLCESSWRGYSSIQWGDGNCCCCFSLKNSLQGQQAITKKYFFYTWQKFQELVSLWHFCVWSLFKKTCLVCSHLVFILLSLFMLDDYLTFLRILFQSWLA